MQVWLLTMCCVTLPFFLPCFSRDTPSVQGITQWLPATPAETKALAVWVAAEAASSCVVFPVKDPLYRPGLRSPEPFPVCSHAVAVSIQSTCCAELAQCVHA